MMDEVSSFLQYIKRTQKKKDNTIISYGRDLETFARYLKENYNAGLIDCKKTHILTFLLDMQRKSKNSSTISRYLSSIKSYYRYLVRQGKIEINPSYDIKSPKVEKKNPEFLSEKQVLSLLDMPDINFSIGYRDKTILELIYSTGIHITELIELSLDDYNSITKCINIDSGHKRRIIPIGSIANDFLERYINNHRKILTKKTYRENAIFVNSQGKRLTRQGLWKILKKYFHKLGIDKNITPQVLRNSVVKHLLDNGADITSICKLLGTEKIYAIDFYSEKYKKNPMDILSKFHPRA